VPDARAKARCRLTEGSTAPANLFFSDANCRGGFLALELAMMRSETPEQFGIGIR